MDKSRELRLLKARAGAFKTTLGQATSDEKQGNAGVGLAENFNKILGDIRKAFPELESSLPQPIKSTTSLRKIAQSNASYLDVQVLADQILALLEIADEE